MNISFNDEIIYETKNFIVCIPETRFKSQRRNRSNETNNVNQ